MSDTWTIQAALEWTEGYLGRKGDENPRLSAQWLMAEATGLSRIELYTRFDQPLSMEERDILRGYVTRRGAGEPLQYITGEVGFRHITVKVRPGVLIPRPETEVLVSEALSLLPAPPKPRAFDPEDLELDREGEDERSEESVPDEVGTRSDVSDSTEEELPRYLVADICTGSGCIACSVAYEHPQTTVIATDIADEAIALARENVDSLGLGERVVIVQGDLGTCLTEEVIGCDPHGIFDLIVSNPPYVPTAVMADIPAEVVDYEPALALDGGADGLTVYRRLLPWCASALKSGGACAFELHEDRLEQAAYEAQTAGFVDVRIVNDLTGRPRVLTARKP